MDVIRIGSLVIIRCDPKGRGYAEYFEAFEELIDWREVVDVAQRHGLELTAARRDQVKVVDRRKRWPVRSTARNGYEMRRWARALVDDLFGPAAT